jgi:hypothetical protein
LRAPDGRAVLALLANDDTRRLFASIALGQTVDRTTKRDQAALQRLLDAGLVVEIDGAPAVNVAGLKDAIAEFSRPRPEGIDRFVRDERIVDYPSSDADRVQLLTWVGHRILSPGERIDELELTARLLSYTDEHVLLRRYLVDYGVLTRARDGTWYELVQ